MDPPASPAAGGSRAAGRPVAILAGAAALVASIAAGVAFGSGSASLGDLFVSGTRAHAVVVSLRLPRVLLGAVAGGGLAGAGAALQTVLRNPLAEPYILGVSGGAALGATVAIAAGAGGAVILGAVILPAAAFAGALLATFVVWSLVRSGRAAGASLLLAGVVVNSIAGAGILVVEAFFDPYRLQVLVWWLMGYVDVPTWGALAFVAVYVAGGLAVLLVDAARMNLLALGDESAATLGVDVAALERRSTFACAAVVGAIVSATGLVGFVGLVVPQGMRRIVGPDLRALLPVSILSGAAVLVACDTLVRVLARSLHTEIPVGALTSLLGGPLFLALLTRAPR
jgi:iron complex transport system permease protein